MKRSICLVSFAMLFCIPLFAQRLHQSGFRLKLKTQHPYSIHKPHAIKRATALSLGYNLSAGAGLLMMPTRITNWKREEFIETAGPRLRTAWTQAPVWDKDSPWINYAGHPYQGAFYYNSLRSQGRPIWQSALFVTGQTLFWEFVFEAVKERPSRQDLITTPIGGVLLGELTHRMTLRMRRRGFTFWEKTFITIFNPAYVLNHGYR
ncbi:MAG: DUF3943 domain-containing protein [Bacteroidota bacterium]